MGLRYELLVPLLIVLAGVVHLHVRVARVERDVLWLKELLVTVNRKLDEDRRRRVSG